MAKEQPPPIHVPFSLIDSAAPGTERGKGPPGHNLCNLQSPCRFQQLSQLSLTISPGQQKNKHWGPAGPLLMQTGHSPPPFCALLTLGRPLDSTQLCRAKCPSKSKHRGLPGQAEWEREKQLPVLSMPTHMLLQPFCMCAKPEGEAREGADFSLGERLQGRIHL